MALSISDNHELIVFLENMSAMCGHFVRSSA